MAFRFEPQEWWDCWRDIQVSIQDSPKEPTQDHAEKFFRARYTNQSESDWKCDRFLRAYRYLDRNLDSFEKHTGVIASKSQFSASADVIIALYRFFGTASDEIIDKEPPVDRFIAAAEEQRRGRPDNPS